MQKRGPRLKWDDLLKRGEQYAEMQDKGHSAQEIADLCHVKVSLVYSSLRLYRQHAGTSAPPPSRGRKPDQALRLLSEEAARWLHERPELEYKHAAAKFRINKNAVMKAWRRLGLPPRKRGGPRVGSGVEAARWLHDNPQADYHQAATVFGISKSAVQSAWYRSGYPPRQREHTGLGVAAARWLHANPKSTFEKAGEAFGVTRQRVEQAWQCLGFPSRKNLKREPRGRGIEAARWLKSNPDNTTREAAKRFGVPYSAVLTACKVLGVKPRRKQGAAIEAARWLNENQEHTIKDASEIFKVNIGSIQNVLSQLRKLTEYKRNPRKHRDKRRRR